MSPRIKKKKNLNIKLPPPQRVKPTVKPKLLQIFKTPLSRTPTGPETKVPPSSPAGKTPPTPSFFHTKFPPEKTQVPLPPPSDKAPRVPQLFRTKLNPPAAGPEVPYPRSRFDHYPHLLRITKFLSSLFLKVEPETPKRIPRMPVLGFPRLYSRLPAMKTVTGTTDGSGHLPVTFSCVFQTVPGVVLTPKGSGTWTANVYSATTTGFVALILKTAHSHGASSGLNGEHNHGGTNNAGLHAHGAAVGFNGLHNHGGTNNAGSHEHGGASGWEGDHNHSLGLDGDHSHSVSGYLTLNLYRALAMVTANVVGAGAHTHTNPSTGNCSSCSTVVMSLSWGSTCDEGSGNCVTSFDTLSVAGCNHSHPQGATGSDGYHTHTLSAGFNNFVYDGDITIGAWTSSTDGDHSSHSVNYPGNHEHGIPNQPAHLHPIPNQPTHDHSIPNQPAHAHPIDNQLDHDHTIAEDQSSALTFTEVTFTYFAQEETT